MNLSPKIIGAVRVVATLASWAALTAVLQYFSVEANVLSLGIDPYLAGVIAMIVGSIDAHIESKTGNALLGTTRVR